MQVGKEAEESPERDAGTQDRSTDEDEQRLVVGGALVCFPMVCIGQQGEVEQAESPEVTGREQRRLRPLRTLGALGREGA